MPLSDNYYNETLYENAVNAALDAVWIPYYFIAAYILPVIVVVSLACNTTVIAVFLTGKVDIGGSVRLYYVTLATLDITSLGCYMFLNFFADGIQYLLPYFNPVNYLVYSLAGCKLVDFSTYCSEISGNWIYVLFSLERLFFIFFPMKARHFITLKFSACCIGFIILVTFLEGIVFLLYGNYANSGNTLNCLFVAPDSGNIMSTYLMFSGYLVAPFANILVCSAILTRLKSAYAKRAEMGKTSAAAAGVQTTINLVIMSSIHSVFHATFGVARCVWLVNRVYDFLPNIIEATRCQVAYNVAEELLITVTHCTNFFIYLTRVKQFRDGLTCSK